MTIRRVIKISALLLGIILIAPVISCSQSDDDPPDQAEKKMVIDKISEWLREYYVFPDVAEKCITKMNDRLKAGAYDKKVNRPVDFVRLLNPDLFEVSKDKHLKIVALFGIEEEEGEIPILEKIDYNHFLQRGNFGFMNVGWKKDNIGYLEFRAFCPPDVAGDKVKSVMSFLSDMDAIIIDLRSLVMGGRPEMVNLISSYFFDKPTLLGRTYFRKDNITEENWTHKIVDQKVMADIPLFILINENVFSAGEGFTYGLQALKRATIIGETSKGGAHITRPFRIGTRYEVSIPWGRGINPVTGTNWEGKGVIPDIKVKSKKALEVALELASKEALKHRKLREAKDEKMAEELIVQFNNAQSLYENGNLDEAKNKLQKFLSKGVNTGLISEEMIDDGGYYLMDNNMLDLAFVNFNFNIKNFPESIYAAGYYHSLAEAFIKKKDRENAIICLKKSLKIDPNYKWAEKLLNNIDEEIIKIEN